MILLHRIPFQLSRIRDVYLYIQWMVTKIENKYYLLQVKLVEVSQVPFHLLGGGPNPLSLKLADSGQIPLSSTPTTISLSVVFLVAFWGKPMKSHDLVVRSCFFSFGNTDTTPFMADYKQ